MANLGGLRVPARRYYLRGWGGEAQQVLATPAPLHLNFASGSDLKTVFVSCVRAVRAKLREPPRFLLGGMFANILPGGNVCQLLA